MNLIQSSYELGLGASQVNATFYRGRGCPACRETGYRGRLGLHELLIMGDSIKDVIQRAVTPTRSSELHCATV